MTDMIDGYQSEVQAAALDAYDNGLCPIRPTIDGEKRPKPVPNHGKVIDPVTGRRDAGWEAYQTERPSRDTVEAWFRSWPGVGLVCGTVSGHLQMIELEGRMRDDAVRLARFTEALERHDVRAVWDRMTGGYLERTPSGGMHTMAHVPGHVAGNVTYARCMTDDGPRPLIETRGDGGFVVVAPSNGTTHPTGGAWTLRRGGFGSIATVTVDEWEAVAAAAMECNEVASDEPALPAAKRLTEPQSWTGGTVGDSWQNVAKAHLEATEGTLGVLLRHGWRVCREDADLIYVTRPGKEGGVSAQIKRSNGRMLNYSSSAPFETYPTFQGSPPVRMPTTTYDAVDVLAVYEYDGDRQAAMHAVGEASGILDAYRVERDAILGPAPAPTGVDPSTGEVDRRPSAARPKIVTLPDEFWTARSLFEHIRTAAHSRGRSADAVLGGVLARAALFTPPTLELPATVGATCGLNLYVASVGASGGGKSTAYAIARELLVGTVRTDVVDGRPLGSGEGVAEAFYGTVSVPPVSGKGKPTTERRRVNDAVLIYVDEGEMLSQIGGRRGSTLLPELRAGWPGQTIGQGNAGADTTRIVQGGTYRLVLAVNWQPEMAAGVLADSVGGFPQRLVWLSAIDGTVPRPGNRPGWPGALTWRPPPTITGGQLVTVADEVAAEVVERDWRRSAGHERPASLDGHRDLSRLKVAALLGVLDGRVDVSVDDWQYAGMILDTSDGVRSLAIAAGQTAVKVEGERRAEAAAHRAVLVDSTVDRSRRNEALARMARAVARRLRRDAPAVVSRRDLTRATNGADRALVSPDEAIDAAIEAGWAVEAEGGWTAGPSQPG